MEVLAMVVFAIGTRAFGHWPSFNNTPSNICEQALSQPANATGTESSLPGTGNGLGQWMVSVTTNHTANEMDSNAFERKDSPGAIANVWLDPFTDIHLDYGGNLYSACAFIFKALPENTIRRGQHDDGSCIQTLSEKCIEELANRASSTAEGLVATFTDGPYSNLTPPILGPICGHIQNSFGMNFPKDAKDAHSDNELPDECAPYFESYSSFYPIVDTLVMTGNKTGPVNCTLPRAPADPTMADTEELYNPPGLSYRPSATNATAAASYDRLVQQVWPIMTVVMPPANNSRQGWISGSAAFITCIRAKVTRRGSRTPPALPEPTPVHIPTGKISGGRAAGIAVGCAFGLIAGVRWWLWKRRRATG